MFGFVITPEGLCFSFVVRRDEVALTKDPFAQRVDVSIYGVLLRSQSGTARHRGKSPVELTIKGKGIRR